MASYSQNYSAACFLTSQHYALQRYLLLCCFCCFGDTFEKCEMYNLLLIKQELFSYDIYSLYIHFFYMINITGNIAYVLCGLRWNTFGNQNKIRDTTCFSINWLSCSEICHFWCFIILQVNDVLTPSIWVFKISDLSHLNSFSLFYSIVVSLK